MLIPQLYTSRTGWFQDKGNRKETHLELALGQSVEIATAQFIQHRGGVHCEALVFQGLRRLEMQVRSAWKGECREEKGGTIFILISQ